MPVHFKVLGEMIADMMSLRQMKPEGGCGPTDGSWTKKINPVHS